MFDCGRIHGRIRSPVFAHVRLWSIRPARPLQEILLLPQRSLAVLAALREQREAQYDAKVDVWAIGCLACAPARLGRG